MRKLRLAFLAPLFLASVASCDPVRFNPVAAPSYGRLQADPPAAPGSFPIVEPEAALVWQVLDRTAKAPFRRKLVGVQATGPTEAQGQRGAVTSALLARLMDDGFQSVIDLSAAPEIDAEVRRTQAGASVELSGKLDRVLTVASPLRADYVLTLRFASLPAVRSSKTVRFTLSAEQLDAYRTAHAGYERSVRDYQSQLDASFAQYEAAFEAAKGEYKTKKGRYAEFPQKTSGQRALDGFEAARTEYQHLRAQAEAALSSVPHPDRVEQEVARKTTTETASRARLAGWASLQETGSNRVVWLAWCQGEVEDPDAALSTLTDSLVRSLPADQKGNR